MIIHQREIGYGENYVEFFEALGKAKAYQEKKYPEVSVALMYNLAGQRGRATIQTRYASLADYERIDAESDNDEAYTEMLKPYAQQGKIDNDPALTDRVYRITGRLIGQAIKMRPETKDWGWRIKIIDDPETVNAWAMAGGKMAPLNFSAPIRLQKIARKNLRPWYPV